MVEASQAKRILRERLRAERRRVSAQDRADASMRTAAACQQMLEAIGAQALASYAATVEELDVTALHQWRWQSGAVVLLPRVVSGGQLAWHAVRGPEQLQRGAYGISEPDPARCPEHDLPERTLILVPGIGFCRDGRRLGQGGGFYDRLLATVRHCTAIGVGFSCQLVDDLPCEAHDRRLDGLIIAGELIRDPRLT
ncbi:MAG: 5-formyltetrahydrofolate cyclo-ligase [Planctomycetota bacterium]